MNSEVDEGFIKASEVHDGTKIRVIERNELPNRYFNRKKEFLEPRADIPKEVRFMEWYLTGKFLYAYDMARDMYVCEGTIDEDTGKYTLREYSTDVRVFVTLGKIDMDATYIPDRAKKARKLYCFEKYRAEEGESPMV